MPGPSPNGRNERGQSARGNPGGPGNPFAERVAALRSALFEAVTTEDVRGIAHGLVDKARAGDAAAVKLLFNYVLGKPPDAVDPDRLDIMEYQLAKALPTEADRLLLELEQGAFR